MRLFRALQPFCSRLEKLSPAGVGFFSWLKPEMFISLAQGTLWVMSVSSCVLLARSAPVMLDDLRKPTSPELRGAMLMLMGEMFSSIVSSPDESFVATLNDSGICAVPEVPPIPKRVTSPPRPVCFPRCRPDSRLWRSPISGKRFRRTSPCHCARCQSQLPVRVRSPMRLRQTRKQCVSFRHSISAEYKTVAIIILSYPSLYQLLQMALTIVYR